MYAWHNIDIYSLPDDQAFNFDREPVCVELDWLNVRITRCTESMTWAVFLDRDTTNCLITNRALSEAEVQKLRVDTKTPENWLYHVESVKSLLADSQNTTKLMYPGLFLTAGADIRDEPYLCIEDVVENTSVVVRWDDFYAKPWSMPLAVPVAKNGVMDGLGPALRAAGIPLTMTINN